MFTASWCGPCQRFKNEEAPKLIKFNWKVGATKDSHVRIVDIDENPEMFAKYRGVKVPLFILFDKEKEISRVEGFQTAYQVTQQWFEK